MRILTMETKNRYFRGRHVHVCTPYLVVRELTFKDSARLNELKSKRTSGFICAMKAALEEDGNTDDLEEKVILDITERSMKAMAIKAYFFEHKDEIFMDDFDEHQKKFYNLMKNLPSTQYIRWGNIHQALGDHDQKKLEEYIDEANILLFVNSIGS